MRLLYENDDPFPETVLIGGEERMNTSLILD